MSTPSTRSLPGGLSRIDVALALLAGITGVAGSYAAAGYSREFLVAPIDALIVRLTPGELVAFMIENVGEEAHLLHIGMAFLLATGLLAGVALVGLVAARRSGVATAGALLAGGLAWGLTAWATAEPVLAVATGVPVAVCAGVGSVTATAPEHDPERRQALLSGAGVFAAVMAALSVGRLVLPEESEADAGVAPGDGNVTVGDDLGGSGGDGGGGAGDAGGDGAGDAGGDGAAADDDGDGESDGVERRTVTSLMAEAEEKSLDVAGDVPALVSTFEEFYNVDISSFDPELAADDWSMTITGEVGDDVTVTFDELRDMPTENRFVTLRCVGEDLNGKKLDTAVWTGTPIGPLLEAADPEGECGCAMLRAADDYFVQFPVEALEDAFLAWGMNGQALPQSHGHPVRALIPGHWGETNVKWLQEIELLEEEMDGYWEQRGWHGTGPVKTVAKLWSTTTLEDGRVEVAGHAYAGTRGVDRVEVSVDGGDTWTGAEISEPLPGDDVWRQWRHEFTPEGEHEVVVRAVDGQGTVQEREESGSFPSGATGWVSTTVRV
jgi:DMSO/TMAO reductase YedYZ molybdopterin-dependent catalytic subunit